MKTILFLSVHTNQWGAERSMCALAANLKKKYNVIVIISRQGNIEELLKDYKIEYHVVPLLKAATMIKTTFLRRVYQSFKYPYLLLKYQWRLELYLKNNKINPDLIYSNTLIPINGYLLSKKYGIHHICHIREFFDEDFHFKSFIGKKKLFSLYRKNCSKFICISDSIQKKFIPLLGENNLIRIYNGITPKPICLHNFHSEEFRVLFVGRLTEEKRPIDAVLAIEKILNKGYKVHLDIYGSGPHESLIRDLIRDKGLTNNVTLCGYVTNIDYSNYNLGLMCSLNEAFGRVTVEYMMAGIPVIGANSGATSEIIRNGITGFLYTPNSYNELAEKIELYYHNRNLCIKHGKSGYTRVLSLFTEEKCFEKIKSLINTLIEEN